MAKLPRNSKQWQLNRELMNNTKPKATIPPLKFGKNWLSEPQSKADCLAKVFSDKCKIPAADGDPAILAAPVVMNDFVPIRRRDVVRVLKALDPSKATGSDKIPARILKECAVEFSIPIMRLVRQMIAEGSWPAVWRRHLVAPIHKKKAKSNPNNYRGVHMTSVLSKVRERIIAKHLARHFEKTPMHLVTHSGHSAPGKADKT